MNFYAAINGKNYDIAVGFTLSDKKNEYLDSGNIILNHVEEFDIEPFNDVIIYDKDDASFKKHFLVDKYEKSRLALTENCYKYKIALMSETKGLEKIQLPNVSITQPLNISLKKSVYQYMLEFVERYNIKIKVGGDTSWEYQNKYTLDSSLNDIFSNVYAPDFSLNNPNLKDVLTQLMLTKDRIPKVEDNVIKAYDLTSRNGVFVFDSNKENYIVESQSSDEYAQNLKTNYTNALSQNRSARVIEKLGFRNSDVGLLTLENMRLETRFPIYKINKIYMCYYKKVNIIDSESNVKEKWFLCKQDITPLIKLNSERNVLSEDWEDFDDVMPGSIDQLGKYKLCTLGYNIGDNTITGWGETYSYVKKGTWWNTEKSYIENIYIACEKLSPMGIYSYNFFGGEDFIIGFNEASVNNIISPFNSGAKDVGIQEAVKLKSFIFEIDYNAFYNGTVIHSKDHNFGSLCDNDNQNQSLSLLEASGLFAKEKINRLGNKEYIINGRYNSLSEVKPLGSVWGNDIIVYFREIAIYEHFVEVTYHLIKDYVLRNYYTSVWAKHRTYNLMPYEESVRRSENEKVFLFMSKDKSYDEIEDYFNFSNFNGAESNDFYKVMMSAFSETKKITSKNLIDLSKQINYGYFNVNNNYFLSDINSFVSGYSLCFNISMFDNVSAGTYISSPNPNLNLGLIEEDSDSLTGSEQKWLLMVDSVETGQIQNISICLAHIDNDNQYYDGVLYDYDVTTDTTINNLYLNNLLGLPKTTPDELNLNYEINYSREVNKDNKEVLDYTFQIEPISDNDNILFSQWFMKLNDLLGQYQKSKTTYQISDAMQTGYAIKGRFSELATGMGVCFPILILMIPNDIIDDVFDRTINFTYDYDCEIKKTNTEYYPSKFNSHITINSINGHLSSTQSDISGYRTISVSLTISTAPNDLYDASDKERYTFNNITKSVQLYRFGHNTDAIINTTTDNKTFWPAQSDVTGYQCFGVILNGTFYNNGVDTYAPRGASYSSAGITNTQGEQIENINEGGYYQERNIVIETGNPNEKNEFKQNIYFFTRNESLNKNIVYNEYTSDEIANLGYKEISANVSVIKDDHNNSKLRIEFGDGIYNTIEYWFYNEESNSYNFVFGVNLSDIERNQKYVEIYLSLIRSGDFNVYNANKSKIGTINNYVSGGTRVQAFYKSNIKEKLQAPVFNSFNSELGDLPKLISPAIVNFDTSIKEIIYE